MPRQKTASLFLPFFATCSNFVEDKKMLQALHSEVKVFTAMKSIVPVLVVLMFLASGASCPANAEGEMHPPTLEEKAFYANVVVPALTTIERAMPPAPQGWAIESRTVIAPSLPDQVSQEPGSFRYDYAVTYKRVEGVSEEQKRLDETAALVQKEAVDAASVRNDELMKKKTLTRQALFKAQKDKALGRERRFKKELEELERNLNALLGETEQKILQATEPLLVKDAGFLVRLSLDEGTIVFPDAKAFTRAKVAFALRKEGTRTGMTGWKETESLVLYGDWQEVQPNSFRARMEKKPFRPKPQTILLSVTGDEKRTNQFMKQMGLKEIVGLMK